MVARWIYLTGQIVTHKQAETITEKLDQYRELSLDDQKLTKTEITKRMGFSANSSISNYAEFWFAVDHNLFHPDLIRVIRVHNNVKPEPPRGRKTQLFRLSKILQGSDRLLYGQVHSVRRTKQQQAALLKEAFESARKWGNIRPEVQTIEECTDDELLDLSYDTFAFRLRCQERDERERARGK